MENLTKNQQVQEEEYRFPYHFADFISDKHKYFKFIEPLDLARLVKEKVKSLNPDLVLDAGCGDGRLSYELKNEGLNVVGIDYSDRAVSFAKGFSPEVEFFIQDLYNLNLPHKFDVIILMEVLEHFIPENIDKILASLKKVLKDDGRLLVTVPSKNLSLSAKHYQHFDSKSLEQTLKPHFIIDEIKGYAKKGAFRKRYKFRRSLGTLFFPFRRSSSLAKRYLNSIAAYYRKNVSEGRPEDCLGLFATCKKSV